MGNAGTNGEASGDFVARVVVPEERLDPRAANGFYLAGFALPFFVLDMISQVMMYGAVVGVSVFALFFIVIGLFIGFRGGVGRGATWWKHVGAAVGNGFSSGFVLALFFTAFTSCSAGLGRAGYAGSAAAPSGGLSG